MSHDNRMTRRTLLQSAFIAAPVALTGCATLNSEPAEKPLVRAADPVARAMAYYPDTGDVPADHPLATNHNSSQKCMNCVHRRESAGPDSLVCPTFPGARLTSTAGAVSGRRANLH